MQKQAGEKRENYLGIDWGTSKIGLALAHAETRVAVAYKVLKNSDLLFKELEETLEKEAIGTIVIGQPQHRNVQGKELVQQFGEKLSKRVGLPVFFTSEMFTTKLAQRSLSLQGEKYPSLVDDAEAARIFLQDWLDRDK